MNSQWTESVPPQLRALIGTAQEWGTLNQDQQDKKLRILLRDHPDQAKELKSKMESARSDIRQWSLDLGFPTKHKNDYTQADWENPYWMFLSTLTVSESIPSDTISPDVQDAIDRMRRELRQQQVAEIRAQANQLFRQKAYTQCAELLRDIEDSLTDAERMKLRMCQKHTGS